MLPAISASHPELLCALAQLMFSSLFRRVYMMRESITMTKNRNRIRIPPTLCLSFTLVLLSGVNYCGLVDFSIVVEAKKNKNISGKGFALPRIPHDTADGDIPKVELHELDKFITDATSYLIKISHTKEQDSKFPGTFVVF